MAVSAEKLLKDFDDLILHVCGPRDIVAEGPSSQTELLKGSIVFIGEKERLKPALNSQASIIVANPQWAEDFPKELSDKVLLSSKNTYLAMALVNSKYFSLPFLGQAFEKEKIDPRAQVHPSAELGENTIVGPGAVILQNVVIGPNSFIGANAVIEPNVVIGENTYIHPQVYIGHSTRIGNRVEIKPNSTIGSDGYGYAHDEKGNHYKIPHYGKLIIEDDVHIGANVSIDRGTFESAQIGKGTKIDNHCHFGHNMKIGENCLITAGFMSAGSSQVGNNNVFGGRVSINGHIKVCDNVQVGPLSGVVSDVTKPGAYMGFPLSPFKDALKVQASIPKLPELRKNLAKVMSKLGIKKDNQKGES